MTAPCGVPSTVSIRRPSSSTPACSHFRISLTILRSPIRCSTNRTSQSWLIVSNEDVGRYPFPEPGGGGLAEIEVTDPGHPLFGRRFPVVSVSGSRASGAVGHALVAHRGRALLKLPLAATSLVPRPPDAGLSKLSVEAMRELIDLAG